MATKSLVKKLKDEAPVEPAAQQPAATNLGTDIVAAPPMKEKTALALPDSLPGFLAPTKGGVEDFQGGGGGNPWASFAHPMSPNWAKDAPHIPSLREGDLVLHVSGSPPEKIDPAAFLYLRGFRYWAKGDDTGLHAATFTQPPKSECVGEKGFKESIEAVILLYHNRRFVPCSVRAASTKTPAFHTAKQTVDMAASPEWAGKSEAHRASCKFPHPFGRCLFTLKLTKGTAKGSGRSFLRAEAVITPTTEEHWSALFRMFGEDAEAKAQLEACIQGYNARLSEIQAMAA